MGKKIGVLVVDDSPICRKLISEALQQDPELEVVGTAADGLDALQKVAELKPQVVTMDVDMPVMDGLTAVERIMAETPTPILVLTADPRKQAPELTCKALEMGALALQVKPALDAGPEAWNLAKEVKLLSSVRVIRHLRGMLRTGVKPAPAVSSSADARAFSISPIGVVAIASSTGGPQVVHTLLSELPGDFPAPIVLVQHINSAFSDSLAGWLAAASKLKIRVAKDGDALLPGEALIAPPGLHMVVPSRGRVSLVVGEPREGHLPSGSLLLESAAKAYGRRAVGMILTGMGVDGADGIAAVKAAGGTTIAQSQESCVVFGMPGAAIARGVVDQVVHGDELSLALLKLAKGERPPSVRAAP
ncbi:MAG: chemotaxis-specific protein-glutamate methyltransferase CheB [Myxococcales bacterium]|nr:chemotaxis-specific protein-glutamate methyltransferase CheB [Myxococcales bacterium]